ncbi:MAG: MFS transporter [Gammaproteobacteria bacterium]
MISEVSASSGGRRTIVAAIVLGAFGQVGFIGLRFIIVLHAIALGASAAAVGLLQASFTLLATILSVRIGHLLDSRGVRVPWMAGLVLMAVCGLLPVAVPGLPVLFVAAAILGTGASLAYVSHVKVVGELSDTAARMGWLSLSGVIFAIATFAAPLLAGLVIDHFDHRIAYTAIVPWVVAAFACIALRLVAVPPPHPMHAGSKPKNVFALLKDPSLRAIYVLSSVMSLVWESFALVVPLYGAEVGLSATAIGGVMSSMAAAMLAVRLLAPLLGRRLTPWRMMVGALFVSSVGYALFPLAHEAPVMMALGALIGLGVGLTQPMTLTLLYEFSPPERVGAAMGLRQFFANGILLGIPIVFGALGSVFGMAPVFLAIAASGFAGCVYARGREPVKPPESRAGTGDAR